MKTPYALVPMLALVVSGCGPQKLALPSDPIGRAATCGVVAAADARSKNQQVAAPLSFDKQGQIVHYALLAGAADQQFSRDKASAVIAQMQEIQDRITSGKWQDLVQPCEAAFPEANLSQSVSLPSDPLTSELSCYMLGKFMTKALASQGNAYEAQLLQYGELARALDPKVAVALEKRGIRSETARNVERNEALSTAAKLGPPSKVMDACSERYAKT